MATSSLAQQTSLNGMSSSFGGRTPVRIHFLDNSSKMLLLDEKQESLDVIKVLLKKFDVIDVDGCAAYFGLYESKNGSAIDDPLKPDVKVATVVNEWTAAESKLVFMIRLFMPCTTGLEYKDVVAADMSKQYNTEISVQDMTMDTYLECAAVVDPNLIHLQYIQAVYHVVTNQFPTTQDQALYFGCLHFFFKFGEYIPSKHVVGFLGNRIVEFIPFKLLKKKSMTLINWEDALLKALIPLADKFTPDKNSNPQRLYMEAVYRLPNNIYGSSFFRCTQSMSTTALPETIIVGVHPEGIYFFDKSTDRKLLRCFKIEDLNRWGYKPNTLFYFETIPSDGLGAMIEVKTTDGFKMSELLSDYAMAFLTEGDKEEARAAERNPPIATSDIAVDLSSGSASRETTEKDLVKAATKIQAMFRGVSIRSRWLYEDCAIHIQAIYRGYKARQRMFALIGEMMAQGKLAENGSQA